MSRFAVLGGATIAMIALALASRANEGTERSHDEGARAKAAQNVETDRGEPFERVLMGLEHRQEWRTIEWRDGIASAIAEATKSGKPIAVVLFLDEYGQSNSPIS
jgi:hypothetical protein